MPDLKASILVGLVLVAGCLGGSPSLRSDTMSGASDVVYEFDPSCQDHEAISGEYIQECSVSLTIEELPDSVVLIRLSVSDSITKETDTWRVAGTGFATRGHIHVIEYEEGDDLLYGDLVTVSALTDSGKEYVLEKHVFSCEDVGYKDACSQHRGVAS